MKKIIFLCFFGALLLGVNAQSRDFWSITGNSNINSSTNFIGTTDERPLIFKTDGAERMRLDAMNGYLGIGIQVPLAPLHLHVNNEATAPLMQISSSNGVNNCKLELSGNPTAQSMELNYEANGYFTIGGIRSWVKFNPAGGLEFHRITNPLDRDPPPAFQFFGGVHITQGIHAQSLNVTHASIDTLTTGALNAQSIKVNGIELGEMNALLLQKIEELTLYIIEQNKKIADLQNQMNELKK
jgi:hypothetical protein